MIEFFQKGGLLMYPILLCSITGVAIIVAKAVEYRRLLRILGKDFNKLRDNPPPQLSPIIKVIEEGGTEEEISVVGTGVVRRLEQGLSWLGLIALIAPLLGLTGTVIGMIRAFMVISENPYPTPSMLAGGIWEALITTAAGLIVAIPIHIGHHWLEKKADDIAFLLREISLGFYRRYRNGV
jgi:biopolymer transport protein ExbB